MGKWKTWYFCELYGKDFLFYLVCDINLMLYILTEALLNRREKRYEKENRSVLVSRSDVA